MKVREMLLMLRNSDPEAEVTIEVSREIARCLPTNLTLPTRDVEEGSFVDHPVNQKLAGKPYVKIFATDAWGISPRLKR